jgi:hypothetical protein
VVIHRVVGGSATDGYEMRGDNRNADDSWHPMPSDAVGEAWIHIPGGGNWLKLLRQPLPFALLMGVIGAGGFIGKSKLQRRRRNGRWKNMGKQPGTRNGLPGPAWLIGIFGALCVLAAVSAFVASQAFRSDTQNTQTVERLRYDETAAYDYTAKVEPSSLYPSGVVGPVTTDAAKDASTTIYSPAAPALDLGLKYELKPLNSPPALDFAGTISAVAAISSGPQGWTKTVDVLPSTAFTGTSAAIRLPVDLAQIQSLIHTIETETGSSSGSYDVVITPTVHITGKLGANAVDDTYSPPFTIKLTKSQVTLDPSLVRSDTKKQEDKVSTPQSMSVFGLSTPVGRARWASTTVGLASLAGALGLAAIMFLGLGRGEAVRIRSRYGSMVISVLDANLSADDSQQIRLASIHDLIRLANRDSRMVMHQAKGDGSNVYFIQDGTLTYLYVSPGGPVKPQTAAQEA